MLASLHSCFFIYLFYSTSHSQSVSLSAHIRKQLGQRHAKQDVIAGPKRVDRWIPGSIDREDDAGHLVDSRIKQKNDENNFGPRFNRLHCM